RPISSAIWRTVLGPRDHSTLRIPSSASVGLRRGALMGVIIYDVLRSCQYEYLRIFVGLRSDETAEVAKTAEEIRASEKHHVRRSMRSPRSLRFLPARAGEGQRRARGCR